MAVSYSVAGGKFVAQKPRVWLAQVSRTSGISPDGKRLAILAQPDPVDTPKAENEVVLLLNFFDELRHRVPEVKQLEASLLAQAARETGRLPSACRTGVPRRDAPGQDRGQR